MDEFKQFLQINFGSFGILPDRRPARPRSNEATKLIKIKPTNKIVPKINSPERKGDSSVIESEILSIDKSEENLTELVTAQPKEIEPPFQKLSGELVKPNLVKGSTIKGNLLKKSSTLKMANRKNHPSTTTRSQPSMGMLQRLTELWQGPESTSTSIKDMREFGKTRSNWNLYVGDEKFKTTFYLDFIVRQTSGAFQNWKLATSVFSFRTLLVLYFFVLIWMIDVCNDTDYKLNGPNLELIKPLQGFGIFAFIRGLMSKWKDLIFFTLSMVGVQRRDFTITQRQILMHSIQFKIAFSLLYLVEADKIMGKDYEIYLVIMHGLNLIAGVMVIDSWPTFACLQVAINLSVYIAMNLLIAFSLGNYQSLSAAGYEMTPIISYFKENFAYTMFATCIFAFFEKISKERFIVNHTNEKTRKFLLSLLDKQISASIIINKNSDILFCNQSFETFCRKKIELQSIPVSLKQFIDEEENAELMKHFIEEQFVAQKNQNDEDKKPKSIEIRIKKRNNEVQNQNPDDSFLQAQNRGLHSRKVSIDPTLNNSDKEEVSHEEESDQMRSGDYFIENEIVRIEATHFFYKDQKCLILTIENVSEQKAQLYLMNMHVKLLTQFVNNFKKRIERLEYKDQGIVSPDTGCFNGNLIETLGNSFLMLNSMLQIQHQFQVLTNQVVNNDVDFLLADEVKYATQGIIISLNPQVQVKFNYEKNLPLKVTGNLEKFKLAILTALEFGIKYCEKGQIDFKVDFDSLSDDRKVFMVSFTLSMTQNKSYNEKPIFDFLNQYQKNQPSKSGTRKHRDDSDGTPDLKSKYSRMSKQVSTSDEQKEREKKKRKLNPIINSMNFEDNFVNKYKVFCELTDNFGMGMIILPSIVWQLGGWCHAQYRKSGGLGSTLKDFSQSQEEVTKEIFITIKVPLRHVESEKTITSPFQYGESKISSLHPSVINSPFLNKEPRREVKQMKLPQAGIKEFKMPNAQSSVLSSDARSCEEDKTSPARKGSCHSFTSFCEQRQMNEKLGSLSPQFKLTEQSEAQFEESKSDIRLVMINAQSQDPVQRLTPRNEHNVNQRLSNNSLNYLGGGFTPLEEQINTNQMQSPHSNNSGFTPSQVNLENQISDQHLLSDQQILQIRQSDDSDSEFDLENVDEYFLSEDYNDFVADKIFKCSPDNSVIDDREEKKQKSDSMKELLRNVKPKNSTPQRNELNVKRAMDGASRNKLKPRSLPNTPVFVATQSPERRLKLGETKNPSMELMQKQVNDVEQAQKEFYIRMQETKQKIAMMAEKEQSRKAPPVNRLQIQQMSKNNGEMVGILSNGLPIIQEVASDPSFNFGVSQQASKRFGNFFPSKSPSYEKFTKFSDQGSLEEQNSFQFEDVDLNEKPRGLLHKAHRFKKSQKQQNKQKSILSEDIEAKVEATVRKWKIEQKQVELLEHQDSGALSLALSENPVVRSMSLLSCKNIVNFKSSKEWCEQKQFQLLLVDDNPFALQPFIMIAQQLKAKFTVCEDGQAAVDAVKQSLDKGCLFDLIFMDLFMPGMNGDAATKQIRVLEQKHQMNDDEKQFILGCSGDWSDNLNKRCLESGMNMLVQKPISMEAFTAILKENDKFSMRKTHLGIRFGSSLQLPNSPGGPLDISL